MSVVKKKAKEVESFDEPVETVKIAKPKEVSDWGEEVVMGDVIKKKDSNTSGLSGIGLEAKPKILLEDAQSKWDNFIKDKPIEAPESDDPLRDALLIANGKLNSAEPDHTTGKKANINQYEIFKNKQQALSEIKDINSGFKNNSELAENYLTQRFVKKGINLTPQQEPVFSKTVPGANMNFLQTPEQPQPIGIVGLSQIPLAEIESKIDKTNRTEVSAFNTLKRSRNIESALKNSSGIEDAAIQFFGSENPQFQKQNSYLSGDLPNVLKGQAVASFLQDPTVIKASKNNPVLEKEWQNSEQNLFNHYPEYGKKIVAQKISQYREDVGKNNPIVNIPRKGATDDVVDEMVEKGLLDEKERAVYKDMIRPELGFWESAKRGVGRLIPGVQANMEASPIATPGVLENTEDSYVNTLRNMAHGVEDISNTVTSLGGAVNDGKIFGDKHRLYDLLARNYSTATVDAKGIFNQIGQAGGQLTGFVAPMILGGAAVEGLGLGATASSTISNALIFEGQNKDRALEMFPGEHGKQLAYTAIATPIDVMLGHLIPNKSLVAEVRGGLQKEIVGTINEFTENKITQAAAKQNIFNKTVDYLKQKAPQVLEDNTKTGGIMSAFDIVHNGLDVAFGGRDMSFDEAANSAVQSFKNGFLGSTFLSAAAKPGEIKNSKLNQNIVRGLVENPETTKSIINEQAVLNPELEATKNERIANLNDGVLINKDLQSADLTEIQKDKYLITAMAQKVWERKAESATEDVFKKDYQKKANELKKIKEDIYNGISVEESSSADNPILSRVQKSGNEGIKKLYNTDEKISELQEQALTTPSNISEKLGNDKELTTDLIANNGTEKIEQQIQSLKEEKDNVKTDDQRTEEIDKHLELLNEGLQKAQKIQDKNSPNAETKKFNEKAAAIGEEIKPILQRINDADYINEKELNDTSDKLYSVLDEVEKSNLTPEQKQSSANLIEPLISKIEGYEFRTKTENGTVTETTATQVARPATKREIKPALEQSAGSEATVTTPEGDVATGTLNIKSGQYVLDVPKGTQRIIGEKAITDRDLSLPTEEEMENPIEFNKDGNVSAVTFKTKSGNFIKISDPAKALDLAIQLRADAVGEVSMPVFDTVYNEVKKQVSKEVLANEGDKPNAENKTQVLTEEATDLIEKFNQDGSKPSYTEVRGGKTQLNTEIKRIAKNNNIEIKEGMSAQDVVDLLKEKNVTKTSTINDNEKSSREKSGEENSKESIDQSSSQDDGEKGQQQDVLENKGGDTGNGKPPLNEKSENKNEIGISHARTNEIASELGFDQYEKNPETIKQWDVEAEKKIKEGYNIAKLIDSMERGFQPDKIEQRIIAKYVVTLKSEIEKNPTNENISDMKRVVEVSNLSGGREVAKSLAARRGSLPIEDSLAGFFVRELDANHNEPLNKTQIENVKKEYEDLANAKSKFEEYKAEQESILSEKKAAQEVKKSAIKSKRENKDYAAERKEIFKNIQDKLKKARQDTNVTIVPYAKELIAIAPEVGKLVKNLVEQGVTKLEDIVNEVHGYLKDEIKDISKKDVHDIIAGEYNNKKTKSDLAKTLFDLKSEAKLISKYESLIKGEEPKAVSNRIERNKNIKDLQEKIRGFEKEKKEAEKTPIEKKTSEEIAIQSIKTRTKSDIEKIEKQIASGDFTPEVKKEPVKLDEEGLKLRDKYLKLKEEREIRIMKQEYANRPTEDKIKRGISEIVNVGRVAKSSFDVSMPFRQGLWGLTKQMLTLPVGDNKGFKVQGEAVRQFGKMYQSLASEKLSRRAMADIHESPRFEMAQKAGLKIAEPNSKLSESREELYGPSILERIPIIGKSIPLGKGKDAPRIGGFVKASERAATTFVNQMKWDIFNNFVNGFESQGKTFENSKELYEAAATYANQSVGRGKLSESVESANQLTSKLFFSLRLQASRLQLMTNFLNPNFYRKTPAPIRNAYLKDMLKFVGTGLTALQIAGAAGFKVGANPLASNFGKIQVGDTEYDIWGGFSQWAVFLMRLASGKVQGKDGELKSQNQLETALRFARSKASPEAGALINVAEGKDYLGRETNLKKEALNFITPLIGQDVVQAAQDGGVKQAFVSWLLATHGVGVQTYPH